MGDPLGIGPEIIVKALLSPDRPSAARIVVVGSAAVMRRAAADLGARVHLPLLAEAERDSSTNALLDLANFPDPQGRQRGPTPEGGRASIEYIETAVRMASEGRVDAIVTCPISKEATGAAGSPYPGHTEMLAAMTGTDRAVMMLVAGRLRVAVVTTHVALRDVPCRVTTEGIVSTVSILAEGLRTFFGVPRPRVAVCGLNPHCGDGGRFGDEEERVVRPAIERLRAQELEVIGPKPADTVFATAATGQYDAVVALYHDQGMIPVKMAGPGGVVNVTLGLPVIRTSVGHGTAYDIAGRGVADEGSLLAALRVAQRMARCRQRPD